MRVRVPRRLALNCSLPVSRRHSPDFDKLQLPMSIHTFRCTPKITTQTSKPHATQKPKPVRRHYSKRRKSPALSNQLVIEKTMGPARSLLKHVSAADRTTSIQKGWSSIFNAESAIKIDSSGNLVV